MVRVLFVCLGNICRSPLAEGILRRQASERGADVFVDSAGTGDWHLGSLPDPRAVKVGISHGCDMTMRGRLLRSTDFTEFDLIAAMDRSNLLTVQQWPESQPAKLRLVRSFDLNADSDEVPDPYYGTVADFESVADMLERACEGILNEVGPMGTRI